MYKSKKKTSVIFSQTLASQNHKAESTENSHCNATHLTSSVENRQFRIPVSNTNVKTNSARSRHPEAKREVTLHVSISAVLEQLRCIQGVLWGLKPSLNCTLHIIALVHCKKILLIFSRQQLNSAHRKKISNLIAVFFLLSFLC